MIRISGGRLRGRQIYCAKGQAVRPTTSFVRESLFSILGPHIQEARFLDLFAGCGIVGIEALSRGAAFTQAIEQAPAHCRLLERNRQYLNLSAQQFQIVCQDVFAWVKRLPAVVPESQRFDIVFLDPPYALSERIPDVIEMCFSHRLLNSSGILIWESPLKEPPVLMGAEYIETRAYGRSTLSFFRYPVWESQTEPPAPSAI